MKIKNKRPPRLNKHMRCTECHHIHPTVGCPCGACDCQQLILPDQSQPAQLTRTEATQLVNGYSRHDPYFYED